MGRRKQRSRGASVSFFSFQDIIASVTGIMILITLLMTIQLISRSYASAQNPSQIQDLKDLRRECDALSRQRHEMQRIVEEDQETLKTLAGQTVISEKKVKRVEDAVRALRRIIEDREKDFADKKKQRKDLENAVADAKTRKLALDNKLEKTQQKIEEERKTTRVRLVGGDKNSKKPYLVECAADRIVVGDVSDTGILRELERFHGLGAGEQFVRWVRSKRNAESEYFVLMVHPGGVQYYHTIRFRLCDDKKLPDKAKFGLGTDVVVGGKKAFRGS